MAPDTQEVSAQRAEEGGTGEHSDPRRFGGRLPAELAVLVDDEPVREEPAEYREWDGVAERGGCRGACRDGDHDQDSLRSAVLGLTRERGRGHQ